MKSINIPEDIDGLAKEAVDAAYHVHRELGPGLLETSYRQCLASELASRGIPLDQGKPIPLIYKGLKIDVGFRADLVLADSLMVELNPWRNCCRFMKPRSSPT